jgi:hypothetical protein
VDTAVREFVAALEWAVNERGAASHPAPPPEDQQPDPAHYNVERQASQAK